MNYVEVREVQTGDAWTANDHDILKGNFEANPPHIITAKGDLPVATGANHVGVLSLGTQGQMLVNSVVSGGKAWTNSGLVPIGGILIWSGSVGSIPTGWALCDGSNGTPDLRGRFVYGSGSPGSTGGAATADFAHTHEGATPSSTNGAHTHTQAATSTDGAHSHSVEDVQSTVVTSGTLGIDLTSPSTTFVTMAHTHRFSFGTSSDGSHQHNNNTTMGSSGDHSHTVAGGQATNTALSNGQSILPPYYALCFIQRKL